MKTKSPRVKINGHRSRGPALATNDAMLPLTTAAYPPPGGELPEVGGAQPVFSPLEVEQLMYRRLNPLPLLNAANLSNANDAFRVGVLTQVARLWQEIACSDETISTVKPKREESVALRAWTTVPLNDSPEAKIQAAKLLTFYQGLRATHAVARHATGGLSMLLTQMMEARAFGYAAHHVMWQPNGDRQEATLGAVFEYVPMEFFEARTGALRFLGLSQGWTGQPLADGEWMVSYSASPLMRAASVLHYYKRLATADFINFSEKYGTPGIVVHTTAQKGTTEGDAASALARGMAGNYRGVLYGAAENKTEVVWPSGGAGGASLPMHTIREDMKRELTSLWLGSDLSTMSRGGTGSGGKAIGGLAQADAQEKREQADCAWCSETLNAAVDPIVIRWFFGDAAPILAKFTLEAPASEGLSLLGNLVGTMTGLGAQIAIEPTLKRLNLPIAKEGEAAFAAPTTTPAAVPEGLALNRITGSANAAGIAGYSANPSRPAADSPVLGKLLASARNYFAEAEAKDLQPLRTALAAVLQESDHAMLDRARNLHARLPHLAAEIIPALGSAKALYEILSAAAAEGLSAKS